VEEQTAKESALKRITELEHTISIKNDELELVKHSASMETSVLIEQLTQKDGRMAV
jgi:hypothetical protein